MKRVAAIAVTTAIGLAGVTHAVLPDAGRMTPAGRQQELQRQYRTVYERQIAEARRKGDVIAEALARDRLRAAEHRPPPDAGKVVRGALRRIK
jgi:hypothetical protein